MASEKSVLALIRAARPTFRNQNDKIAFAIHSSFLIYGYVLTATGPQALSDNALSDPSNDEVPVDRWNELNDEYAFVYANPEKSSEKVLVKCLPMNDKLLVHALSQGSSEPLSLEIEVGDYAGEDGGSNYSQHFKNLDKLVKKIDGDILSKLDGSAKTSSSSRSLETSDKARQEIPEPVSGFGEHVGPRIIFPSVPLGSGSDLVPGPPAGVLPSRSGHGIGGSMLVGPNDPRWFGGIGGDPAFPGGLQGVPPGARFDPYGPPGVPGFEAHRFARNPRRPGYDAHPDLQHFRRDADSDFI
ncbi:probable proteasome inhibitor [Cajanus cajan]|uniref:probable proteasome inhibitor n=1 Tax=Cajanus cajan TaxID=3821 RepID=UPI00098D96B7|nr:probable proteasome inhibitor [Cajanus cajan]XP_020224675.1 probable proteasome inhibitor [Cajanus cajan]